MSFSLNPIDDLDSLFGGDEAQKYAQQGRDFLGRENVEAGPSAFITADPATRAAQLEALGELQAKYHAGGLDAIDRARLGDIQAGVNQAGAVQRAGVEQEAARRGTLNSGNALVAKLVGGQQATELGARQGRDAAALAEQARTSAIMGAGGLAGGIRGQDYERAGAEDAISRFNAAQRLSRAQGIAGVAVDQGRLAEQDAERRRGEFKDITKGVGSYMTGGRGGA